MKKQGPDLARSQSASTSSAPSSSQQEHQSSPNFASNDVNATPSVLPSNQHNSSYPQSTPKVAIPRLRRQSDDQVSSKTSSSLDKNRVAHACEPCRHRKTKCSGERPVCQHCQDFRLTCVYADGKRDRTKKQMGSLVNKVEDCEQLLEDLIQRVGEDDQLKIRRVLDKVDHDGISRQLSDLLQELCSDDGESPPTTDSPGRGRTNRKSAGEDKASGRVGSMEPLDRVGEDINRNAATRATGFHGKNSEITWLQRLMKQASLGSHESDGYEDRGSYNSKSPSQDSSHSDSDLASIATASYHCDDIDVIEADEGIYEFELPLQATADALFKVYLETVHPTYPIIGKNTFVHQYRACLTNFDQAKRKKTWLAILNMIFAIAARYSYLIQSESACNANDHLLYFSRARKLGFGVDAVLGHADLQKVQISGLMAFYLMAVNQINRAWSVSGVAIRHASTLGLNLRNETKEVTSTSREVRYRVWWAVCSIERMLAVMTGRPTSFAETDCTAPMPLAVEEDELMKAQASSSQDAQKSRRISRQESQHDRCAITSPSSTAQISKKSIPTDSPSPASVEPGSHNQQQEIPPCDSLAFVYHTKLSIFTNKVINSLYHASAMESKWSQVQASISDLNAELQEWRGNLHPVFDFTKDQPDQQFYRARTGLGFFYYSTLIIINRPCLCRIDRRIPDQSKRSRNFNREIATNCVRAALNMLDWLPEHPNSVGLYKTTPWWCLVHYLVQAATVLMLEVSFRADHMPNEVDEIFESANKALKWLESMSVRDEAARRAADLCRQCLCGVAPRVGKIPNDVSDLAPNGFDTVPNTRDMDTALNAEMHPQPSYNYASSMPFIPPGFSNYDQLQFYDNLPSISTQAPYNDHFPTASEMPDGMNLPNTSTQAPYNDLFPTAPGMQDGMNFHDYENPSYYPNQDQNWYPGGGPEI